MGLEARCTARSAGKSSAGKALLETDRLIFRGDDLRLDIPLAEIRSLRASGGALHVRVAGYEVAFDLGPEAARWEERIRNPKSLLDKLGVKPTTRVALIGVDDPAFRDQIAARCGEISERSRVKEADILFFAAARKSDLGRVSALAKRMKPDGAIWITFPKGVKEITASEVMAAGKSAGLVDVKVVSFSPTETALKFVIPVKDRKKRGA